MPTRRPLRLVFVCIIALALLTGCVTSLAPVRPLLTENDARSASEVAVAVQANGIKHYLWTECGAGTCQLVYQRIRFGAPIYQYTFTAASGTTLQHPDVVVTADGRAFVVHRFCFSACIDYYSIIPADANDSTVITLEQLASPTDGSAGPPKIAARDNVVYATYLIEGDSAPRLRYRQLSGGNSGGYVELRPTMTPSQPSLAIGSNGALYVTWKANTGSSSEIAYGTNNGTSGDFPTVFSYDFTGNLNFRNPDIALDPNNTPYIVYAYDGGASDIVTIRCEAAITACFGEIGTRTIPLNAAQNPWRLRGSPHIQLLNWSPAVVFAADNSVTDNNEIWFYTPPSSGIDPGPTRATNNAVQDDEPQIVVERSNYGDVPVVAWRTYITLTIPDVDCFGDAYMFYFTTSTLRRVFTSTGGCFNFEQELAANGQWVAGVWLDHQSSENSRLVPWTLFNAHTVYTPTTAK